MNTLNNIDQLNQILSESDTLSALRWLSENPDYRPVFSTSFGQEDQVLTDLIFRNNLDIDLFTLDTGRLFSETHVVMNETLEKYGKKIDVYYPVKESVDKIGRASCREREKTTRRGGRYKRKNRAPTNTP